MHHQLDPAHSCAELLHAAAQINFNKGQIGLIEAPLSCLKSGDAAPAAGEPQWRSAPISSAAETLQPTQGGAAHPAAAADHQNIDGRDESHPLRKLEGCVGSLNLFRTAKTD